MTLWAKFSTANTYKWLHNLTGKPDIPKIGDDYISIAPIYHQIKSVEDVTLEQGKTRTHVLCILIIISFFLIFSKLVNLMVTGEAENGAAHIVYDRTSITPFQGRGDIYDRNGVLLATDVQTYDLYLDALEVVNPEQSILGLKTLLPHLHLSTLQQRFYSTQRNVRLARHLSPRKMARILELGEPGLRFEKSYQRVYPQGAIAAHVVGATNADGVGITGIERAMEETLSQGRPITLSIDINVQYATREKLLQSMNTFDAKGAAAVVQDSNTGEVLAMVSLPDYQPENYGNAESEQQFNKAVQGIYEMGSTFKVFTAALAMHEGIADENTLFDATDPLKIDRFTINDFHGKKRPLFVSEVLQYSSNIGSARMALDVGGEKQKNFLKQLGLLDQSPIEIKEQSHPLSPSVWRKTSTATISYGHGISVSPVHLSTAISAMVNGGIMVQPTLLKRSTPIIKKRVISEKVSENIRAMMRLVATAGSARKANVKGYHVGGKTGSAEKIRNGRYVDGLLRTTFVSAFPMDAPKYTVVTLLDEPQGTKATYGFNTSGWNAAPTAGAIIQTIGPMLGVPPRDYVTPIELKMNALPTIENSEPLIQEARHAAR